MFDYRPLQQPEELGETSDLRHAVCQSCMQEAVASV